MRSVLSKNPGGPDTLVIEDIAEPDPATDEVRISVHSVGINYPDLLIIEDRYQYKPKRPFSPGAELAGVVDALGRDVTSLTVGQRVVAVPGWGGLAEKICVKADRCSLLPDTMPFDEASSLLMTYGTSYHALVHRAGLRNGETLLVLGAGGGVGLAAVELGKALGARVVAAASGQEKLDAARALGADATLLYPRGPLGKQGQRELSASFKKVCGGQGANVIYDPVGGEYTEPALRCIAWEGRYLVVGFAAGVPSLPLNLPLLKGCDVRGVFWGAATERDPETSRRDTQELLKLYQRRVIHPTVHKVFSLDHVAAALKALASREVVGKIVVNI